MRIEHRNSGNFSRLRGASGGSSEGPGSGRTQASASGKDQVQISTAHSYLAAAQASVQGMSAAYAARVSDLSDAVSAGSYQINAWAVSGGIIREQLQAA
jgi:flagellar biosynthesis anti-sigma factor FlgM